MIKIVTVYLHDRTETRNVIKKRKGSAVEIQVSVA